MFDKKKAGDYLVSILDSNFSIVYDDDDSYITNEQQVIHALLRSISSLNGSLRSIKTAIERVDGKVEQPVEIRIPQINHLFPYAKKQGDWIMPIKSEIKSDKGKVIREANQLPSKSIRRQIRELRDKPFNIVKTVVESPNDFPIKLVIACSLYYLAIEFNDIASIDEILDQLDGKVADVIEIYGEDIEIQHYNVEAPANAKKINGQWQIRG